MRFRFVVEVEVKHLQGKFVSRDEISDQIKEALDDVDPGSIYVDESEYEVCLWEAVDDTAAERSSA